MAEQRQPFRFRLPWLTAPQQAPAAPRPSQATQVSSQPAPAPHPSQGTPAPSQPAGSQMQRPPFRPAGVAPSQPPPPSAPPVRAEPPSSYQSSQATSNLAQQAQETKLFTGPPVSPVRTVPQIKATPRPASPARVSSKPQATKPLPQLTSPSRRVTQLPRPKTIVAPLPTSSQAKSPSPTKKPPSITSEISQNPNEVKQRETSIPPSEKLKPVFEELKTRAPTKFAADGSRLNQEPKPQPVKQIYETSNREPKQVLKGTYDRLNKDVSDKEVTSSNTQTKIHHEQGQQLEEVLDIKKVFQKFENGSGANEGEIHDRHARVTKFPHKHGMAGGQKNAFHKEVKENLPKSVQKQGVQRDRHLLNEKPFFIVTLTGENTGAIMHLSSESQRKERPIYIHRGYKIKSDEVVENITDVNEGSSSKRKSGDTDIQEKLATESYVNNNTQGINNSLVFNSTLAEKNPGVHLVLSQSPIEPVKPQKEREMLDTHKVKVTSTPAERLAYAPTIRRRCLRGLFLESSDSDLEKSRRHGCRIACAQNKRDNSINVR